MPPGTYDHIIVGAGSAGCVLASRLSEDSSVTVLLLEHGGPARSPLLAVPRAFPFTLRGDRYAYHYRPTGSAPVEEWIRGKVEGGSGTVSGMIYNRGAAPDYDHLVELGNPGWGWKEMLPVFRSMEDHQLGASGSRGAGGRLHVSVAEVDEEVTDAIITSAGKLGAQLVPDVNEHDAERIGFAPATIRRGVRVSAASAFLRPALKRPNLTYLDRTKVGLLLFDGDRVVGVRAQRGGGTHDHRAAKEVILCAGTIESALLLERSGIGRPEVLAAAGVRLRVESPNVGERVIEHRAVAMQARLNAGLGHNPRLDTVPKQLWEAARYLVTRHGPIATGAYDLVSFVKSSPGAPRPDILALWAPLSFDLDAAGPKVAKHPGLMFLGYALRPTTTSTIHISGSLPESPPLIDARFLDTEHDRRVTGQILARARDVLAERPLADLVLEEEWPGPTVSTPDEVVNHALRPSVGVYHAVGSNGMGPSGDDVVDPRLRVRGVDGLRVADASVFPTMIAGHTAAPVMALAWRAADLVAEDNA